MQLTIFSGGEKMRGGTTCPTGEIGAAKGERKRRTEEREKGGWPTLWWSVWLDRSRVAGLCELRFLSLSSGEAATAGGGGGGGGGGGLRV